MSGFGSISFVNLLNIFDKPANMTTVHSAPHHVASGLRRDELIAICAIVAGMVAFVLYVVLTNLFRKRPAVQSAVASPPATTAVTVVTARPVAIPTTATYCRVTTAEAAVIQIDPQCIQVNIEIV